MQTLCSQKKIYFSEKEHSLVLESRVPRHVAIIMDGNRRWGKKNFFKNLLNPLSGHWAGANVLPDIIEAASEIGIKVLTLYAFSTENWLRSPKELEVLFSILETFLKENRCRMQDQGIRFETIGNLNPFPAFLKEEIEKTKSFTKEGCDLSLVIALNYGGRDELCRAFKKMHDEILFGNLKKEEISEECLSKFLDTAQYGDPDLLIRTSGEMRISNFLLWQLAYTEIYVTDILWPDFTPRELFNAVLEFQKRQRRLGR